MWVWRELPCIVVQSVCNVLHFTSLCVCVRPPVILCSDSIMWLVYMNSYTVLHNIALVSTKLCLKYTCIQEQLLTCIWGWRWSLGVLSLLFEVVYQGCVGSHKLVGPALHHHQAYSLMNLGWGGKRTRYIIYLTARHDSHLLLTGWSEVQILADAMQN